jgi:hypothetical protein
MGLALSIESLNKMLAEVKADLEKYVNEKGIPMIYQMGDQLGTVFPGIHQKLNCPDCGAYTQLYYILVDLNDDHGWTREQIADWLETLDIDITLVAESSGD